MRRSSTGSSCGRSCGRRKTSFSWPKPGKPPPMAHRDVRGCRLPIPRRWGADPDTWAPTAWVTCCRPLRVRPSRRGGTGTSGHGSTWNHCGARGGRAAGRRKPVVAPPPTTHPRGHGGHVRQAPERVRRADPPGEGPRAHAALALNRGHMAHTHTHTNRTAAPLPSSFASVSGNTAMIRSRYSTHYYLAFHEIDSPSEDEKFYEAAERLLLRINGLGRVENQNFRPVALSDEYTTSDGRRHTVLRPAPAQIRVNVGRPTVTVARPDGTVVPDPPSAWPDRFAAAASNPDLAEALEVLGKPENVWWSDLYCRSSQPRSTGFGAARTSSPSQRRRQRGYAQFLSSNCITAVVPKTASALFS